MMLNELERLEQSVVRDFQELRACPLRLDCEHCPEPLCVKIVAVADFPSQYGAFRILGFVNNRDGKDHIIVLKGDVGDGERMLLRIHSACLTGDALGSRRCDCGPQLHASLRLIEREGRGMVLYHQAEGRGIGLVNKLRAYVLQDQGLDTLDANVALGFAPDERDYRVPAEMLKRAGVRSIRLLTNNPEKVQQIQAYGIEVCERVPIEEPVHGDNVHYLETKKTRFGHFLELFG